MVEITDKKSLRAWLNALPGDEDHKRKVAVTIAHRAAMRVLPYAWREFEFSDWARRQNRTAIPVLRSGLTSGVAAKSPSEQVRAAAARSAAAANVAAAGAAAVYTAYAVAAPRSAADADAAAAYAAYAAAPRSAAADIAADAAAETAAAAGFLSKQAWAQVSTDCTIVEAIGDPMHEPLWQDAENPFAAQWAQLKEQLKKAADSRHWQFWINWYDRSLRGEPQDWEGLLSDVVLIEDEVWKQGFAAVGERISILREKHELLDQIRALKAEREQAQATLAHRSHNMPPELVDAPPELSSSLTDIWEQVDAAEVELEAETPDPSRLLAIGRVLLNACKKVLTYCAEKADVAITKAAEEVGASGAKWAMRAGAVYWVGQTQTAQTIAERLIELAQRLP